MLLVIVTARAAPHRVSLPLAAQKCVIDGLDIYLLSEEGCAIPGVRHPVSAKSLNGATSIRARRAASFSNLVRLLNANRSRLISASEMVGLRCAAGTNSAAPRSLINKPCFAGASGRGSNGFGDQWVIVSHLPTSSLLWFPAASARTDMRYDLIASRAWLVFVFFFLCCTVPDHCGQSWRIEPRFWQAYVTS